MDPTSFFTSASAHLVAGKGGVGKSTLTAALGLAAASIGLDVLLVELESGGGLARCFGRDGFGPTEVQLAPRLRGRAVKASDALLEHLSADRLGRLGSRIVDSGLAEVVSRGTPGLADLVVLGKIKQLQRVGAAQVIMVDGPASGHALSWLRAPHALLHGVGSGPIHAQATEVLEMLADPRRCQVLLVTLPEETPVNEVVETAFHLEDEIGVKLGPVLVNRVARPGARPVDLRRARADAGAANHALAREDLEVLMSLGPLMERAAAHRRSRSAEQQRQLARLALQLPLPRILVPEGDHAQVGPADLGRLGDDILLAIRSLDELHTAEPTGTPAPRQGVARPRLHPGHTPAGPARARRTGAPARPGPTHAGAGPIAEVAATAAIIVCAGSGGVGKTSVAAAVGLEGALLGRRTMVLTIDPARRLADAMGLVPDATRPTHVVEGPWSGELHVTMLDTKDTADRLVGRYASNPAQREEILANRFYANISTSLGGTQEYMAAERLFELHESGDYELIVVDTPPSHQALDFLDAPERLTRFLNHRIYRWVAASGSGRASRPLGHAGLAALRTVGRVVGAGAMSDAVEFLRAFRGMQEGFAERAGQLRALLHGPTTAFFVITTPQLEALREGALLVDQLRTQGFAVEAVILNQVVPALRSRGENPTAAQILALAERLGPHPQGPAVRELAELLALRERQIDGAAALIGPTASHRELPLVTVARLQGDVHDLHGVGQLRRALTSGQGRRAAPGGRTVTVQPG